MNYAVNFNNNLDNTNDNNCWPNNKLDNDNNDVPNQHLDDTNDKNMALTMTNDDNDGTYRDIGESVKTIKDTIDSLTSRMSHSTDM